MHIEFLFQMINLPDRQRLLLEYQNHVKTEYQLFEVLPICNKKIHE